eukprot:TRINITY_DN12267_c0_g1_i2.p1 TRINITY_DN12267_c0_g1~~TRINITY_DN12267_c0_g1_i2.p1  ORF type:complete len:625 (+),score=172.55 TRINITY_DN12267_c0_g1_i2:202-2076(+)
MLRHTHGSAADEAGVKRGRLISIDGHRVTSRAEVVTCLERARSSGAPTCCLDIRDIVTRYSVNVPPPGEDLGLMFEVTKFDDLATMWIRIDGVLPGSAAQAAVPTPRSHAFLACPGKPESYSAKGLPPGESFVYRFAGEFVHSREEMSAVYQSLVSAGQERFEVECCSRPWEVSTGTADPMSVPSAAAEYEAAARAAGSRKSLISETPALQPTTPATPQTAAGSRMSVTTDKRASRQLPPFSDWPPTNPQSINRPMNDADLAPEVVLVRVDGEDPEPFAIDRTHLRAVGGGPLAMEVGSRCVLHGFTDPADEAFNGAYGTIVSEDSEPPPPTVEQRAHEAWETAALSATAKGQRKAGRKVDWVEWLRLRAAAGEEAKACPDPIGLMELRTPDKGLPRAHASTASAAPRADEAAPSRKKSVRRSVTLAPLPVETPKTMGELRHSVVFTEVPDTAFFHVDTDSEPEKEAVPVQRMASRVVERFSSKALLTPAMPRRQSIPTVGFEQVQTATGSSFGVPTTASRLVEPRATNRPVAPPRARNSLSLTDAGAGRGPASASYDVLSPCPTAHNGGDLRPAEWLPPPPPAPSPAAHTEDRSPPPFRQDWAPPQDDFTVKVLVGKGRGPLR